MGPRRGQKVGIYGVGPRCVSPHPTPFSGVEEIVGECRTVQAIGRRCGINIVSVDIAVVDAEFKVVGIAYLIVAHVDLNDSESRAEIGKAPAHINIIDRLVARYRGRIEVGQVGDITLGVEHIDIIVAVDDNKLADTAVPLDLRYATVAETVDLIVGLDAAVALVIGIEIVGSEHIKHTPTLLNVLYIVVGHIVLPRSYLRLSRTATRHCQDRQTDKKYPSRSVHS